MMEKYLEYWDPVPLSYSIAIILDPRSRFKGLDYLLRGIGNKITGDNDGKYYARYFSETKLTFTNMFRDYERRWKPQRRPVGTEAYSTEGGGGPFAYIEEMERRELEAADGIAPTSYEDPAMASSSRPSYVTAPPTFPDHFDELTRYQNLPRVEWPKQERVFPIIEWWEAMRTEFPILSRMARDFLCIPASTVSSESAFSSSGALIGDRRHSLSEDHVEEFVCVKDWVTGDRREHKGVENDETYINQFNQCYIEGETEDEDE